LAIEFLDSNVLVYAFTTDPRAEAAQALLQRGCAVSVQALNEFANVARRKLHLSWSEVREALTAIRVLCAAVTGVDDKTHDTALDIAERYGFAVFDALMIAAALQAGADTLWSEDMQNGMIVAGKLRIANPFQPAA
jgi:predicted nucleic acid-binding protein